MSDKTKKVSEWEVLKGCIAIKHDPDEILTEDEFNAIPVGELWGVDHPRRIKFLEDNGYEVNRENMTNVELSAKPPTKKKR